MMPLSIILFIHSTPPLKILFIVNQFPCISQRFILELILECINRNHIIKIHAFKKGDPQIIKNEMEQYNLHTIITYGEKLPVLQDFNVLSVQCGHYAKKVIDQAQEQNYSGAVIVSFRGYDISKFIKKNPHYYTNLFPYIDVCLPVCNFFKKRLIELGSSHEKISVLHSGVNLDLFINTGPGNRFKRAFNIITIARFVKKKGIEYGLRAIELLKKKFPVIQYFIIGDEIDNSGEKARLKNLALHLGISQMVHFCGWQVHEDIIKKYLPQMHVMILPSITSSDGDEEGIPNVLKEALLMGIPVITTERVGSELIINGESGFLVPEKNYRELAEKIVFFIKNYDKGKQFGQAGREFVSKYFDIKKITTLFETVIYNVIKKKESYML